jgi:hypothetical protein
MDQETLEFEDQDEQEDEQIDEVPVKVRKINSEKSDESIYNLCRRHQKGNLDLQPEYQRQKVWDDTKSSRLIESVLLKVPIPVVYLSEESDNKYSVIDGQQRLDAFIRFHKNELTLKGLTILTDLNGKKFEELSDETQSRFEDAKIHVIEILKESDPDVKFDIFERLNTGAVPLNAQELRNCIYRGSYNRLINELSEEKDFLSLLGLEKPHARMQDRELVLRFFAFYNNTYLKYTSSMKRFLNKEIEQHKNLNEQEEAELRNTFRKSVRLTKKVFGDKAFKRFVAGSDKDSNGKWENLNKGLFDIIMFGFTNYEDNQIVPKSDMIREKLLLLMTHDESFINSISGSGTDNKDKTFIRFDIWLHAINEIIGISEHRQRLFSLEYKEQLFRSNPTCLICGNRINVLDDAEVDHIEQHWKGGETIPSNARLTHRYCNRARPKDELLKNGKNNETNHTFVNINIKNPSSKKISRLYTEIRGKDFFLPILQTLSEHDGILGRQKVFEYIEQKMGQRFDNIEKCPLQDKYTNRWKKKVDSIKCRMQKEGYIETTEDHLWKITEKGSGYLLDNRITW